MAELNLDLEHGLHISVSSTSLTVGLLLLVCVKGVKFILNSDLQHGLNLRISSRTMITVFVSLLCFTLIQVTLHSAHLKGRSALSTYIPSRSSTQYRSAGQVTANHTGRSAFPTYSPSGSSTPYRSDIQSVRMQQLKNVCKKKPDDSFFPKDISRLKNTMSHILVDDYNKVLYCYIPKTGCSLWKGLLMNMSRYGRRRGVRGDVHAVKKLNTYGIRELKTYVTEEILFRLKTYYKFLYVRHPFTRLVSAFRDKFTGKRDSFFAYLPKMLNYTRKLNNKVFVNETQKYNFTFTEFLEYSFESPDVSFRFNEHWNNLESLCSPCFIDYGYIGKQETFNQDTRIILLNVFKKKMSVFGVPNWTGTDERKAKRYFRDIPEGLKAKVAEFYSRDAEMFGYDLQDY